jgi:hypothetical protein
MKYFACLLFYVKEEPVNTTMPTFEFALAAECSADSVFAFAKAHSAAATTRATNFHT